MIGIYGASKFKFWLTGSITNAWDIYTGVRAGASSYFVPCAETASTSNNTDSLRLLTSCRIRRQ
jgi:hypothetical protein